MMENQAKEEMIEMKVKPEQKGKTYRKSSRVRLGIEVPLGVASLHLGEGPPLADEDTCLRLGKAQFA